MIRVSSFAGELPRLIPRLLQDNFAQIAENVRVEKGDLLPIRASRFVQRLNKTAKTIFKNGDKWLGFDGEVYVVPAPIAENRLYLFGDGVPKLMVGDTVYPLAVPIPSNGVIAVSASDVDKDNSFTVLYGYTWLTEFDEESEVSDLSNSITIDTSSTVELEGFAPVPQGRAVNRMRIYRSQTSTAGDTILYFIAEREATSNAFTDVIELNPIQEQLPSADYNRPPATLTGAVSLPNGMMAAFTGKKVYFCEPYRPHAWPEGYVLTVDYDIVGLSGFGSSLAIMTKGNPYVAQGTAPENMVMERLRVNLPCVSAKGIVDLGYSVAYPSPQGLVTVSQSGAGVASEGIFTQEQWRLMQPESFIAAQFGGRYLLAYNYLTEAGTNSRGIMTIDLSGAMPFAVRGNEPVDELYFEIGTGLLYMLRNGTDIYEYDSLSQNYTEFHWKSKKFVLNTFTAFGCILIEGGLELSPEELAAIERENEAIREQNRDLIERMATGGPVADEAIGIVRVGGSLIKQLIRRETTPGSEGSGGTGGGYTDLPSNMEPSFEVKIWGDGKLVFTGHKLNVIDRLPARQQYRTWEIEIRSNQSITGVTVAYAPSEIAEAG